MTATEDKITSQGLKNSSSNLISPNNIIVCTRMGLGKIVINKIEVAINQDLKALSLPKYFEIDYFFNFYITLKHLGTGVTVKGIRQD